MARLARVAMAEVAYHVTQRGNGRHESGQNKPVQRSVCPRVPPCCRLSPCSPCSPQSESTFTGWRRASVSLHFVCEMPTSSMEIQDLTERPQEALASKQPAAAIGAGGNKLQLAGRKMASIDWHTRNIGRQGERRESQRWARSAPAGSGFRESGKVSQSRSHLA